ncbi:dolichyl-phosphate-mannose-protein mannosyltransferase [Novosphingobium kunmingense]|uniref:Dolichyl-phosphate-mannose-protein mannosyltransferase n=1 Tax=Novosphingobium kunmingense TaxID=1211806 RepID=A0A2N0I3N0_9SPHN|nr:dolichyl-phosphate-mannose-protein mannosyltransferase [Novosphingobium kunmingense]
MLLLVGLALRIATFGDPNLHVDEAWYFLVGHEMHHGAIPYVTIWDRKPVGLFLLYYLFAGISTSVLAYQIPALLFASATAWVIARIAARLTGAQGAVLAGASYLLMLGPLEGFGGQTPVFYNLLIAGAAWLVLQSLDALDAGRPGWRMVAAMALAGTALTFKQTTMFEAAFLGLFAAWRLWRSPAPRRLTCLWVALWIAVGAAPTLACAAWYSGAGYWSEYWQAMYYSNVRKSSTQPLELVLNISRFVLATYPLWGLYLLSLLASEEKNKKTIATRFCTLWIASSMCGIAIIPNFYVHYAIPIVSPFLLYISLIFDRRDIGFFCFTFVLLFTMVLFNPANRLDRKSSIESTHAMVRDIAANRTRGGLFVFDGPSYVYAIAEERPPGRLVFPYHFSQGDERNVSHIDTAAETRRILRNKPEFVMLAPFDITYPSNVETRQMVETYVFSRCTLLDTQLMYDIYETTLIGLWGKCKDGPGYIDY